MTERSAFNPFGAHKGMEAQGCRATTSVPLCLRERKNVKLPAEQGSAV